MPVQYVCMCTYCVYMNDNIIMTLCALSYLLTGTLISIQVIEFFFFAALIFVVTIIFAIMSFFYMKYVDLSDRDNDPLSRDSTYNSKSSHDDYSALLASSSREQKSLYNNVD